MRHARRLLLIVALATGLTTADRASAQGLSARGRITPDGGATATTRTGRVGALPPSRSNLAGVINGNALDSLNRPIANAGLRLRDARNGRIVGTSTADRTGLFTFAPVDPGSYIVELLGSDQTILAASEILNVNAGDATSAIVKLATRTPPLGGVLGRTAGSAALVTAAAAASGVLATQITGNAVSPRQ